MGRRSLTGRRLLKSIALGLLPIGLFVSAGRAATWNASCGSGKACVWGDSGYGVPLAATTASESDYGTHNYPNTQTGMNGSVSSIRNRFGAKDVVFYVDAGYSGANLCLNAGGAMASLPGFDDAFSSHVIAIASTC